MSLSSWRGKILHFLTTVCFSITYSIITKKYRLVNIDKDLFIVANYHYDQEALLLNRVSKMRRSQKF